MKLQEKIQADFLAAYKTKDEVTKNALSMLKNAISIELKKNGATMIEDDNVIKVINSMIKSNEKSASQYPIGAQEITNLNIENEIVSHYLPAAFTGEELIEILQKLSASFSEGNLKKRIGQTMGAFNKLYAGKAKNEEVKRILETILNDEKD